MAAIQGTPEGTGSSKVDPTVPRTARIWNYWLGGKDNYPGRWPHTPPAPAACSPPQTWPPGRLPAAAQG